MRIPLFHVDAFTSKVFSGNPAAVCPLKEWLPDSTLQAIAQENNLSETAFFVPQEQGYHLRWFTPEVEIDLCGHATLAAASIIFERIHPTQEAISFSSMSGPLVVTRDHDRLRLDFPSRAPKPAEITEALVAALGARPVEVHASRDLMAVFESEDEVAALRPSFDRLQQLNAFGVIATAKGNAVDFVSRYFAPSAGVLEDPVTGSAHCTLIPYWSKRLGKTTMLARQISKRGGELHCVDRGERVWIGGHTTLYMEGFINLP